MSSPIRFRHQFVSFIPEQLSARTLYISIEYATTAHLCMCGCNNKVVAPISPTDWCVIFNGETVSLEPSIGSWNLRCQSHYWITNNEIIAAPGWTKKRISSARNYARSYLENFFKNRTDGGGPQEE